MFTNNNSAASFPQDLAGTPIGMPEQIFRERAGKGGFKLPPKRDLATLRRSLGMLPWRGEAGRLSGWQAANDRFQSHRKDAAAHRDYDRDCRDNADIGMPPPDPRDYFGWEDAEYGDTCPRRGKPPGPHREDVCVHEAGHAAVAAALGVKVLRLVGYEHNNMAGACYPDFSHLPQLSIYERTAVWPPANLP